MLCLPRGSVLTSFGLHSIPSHHSCYFISCSSIFPHPDKSPLRFSECRRHHYGKGDRHPARGYRSIIFDEEQEEEESSNAVGYDRLSRFEEAIKLFNRREYYDCHDLLESLWYEANEPLRTLLHGLLQCAVAFHHLFNQNHKGAMMEMGEAVCKLRKLDFEGGPFHEFEQEMSAVLNFIYQTQLELAACNEDFCVAMEQTEKSYQLLEGFGAGQHLYFLEGSNASDTLEPIYIVFDPQASYGALGLPLTKVKLPTLHATRDHLVACQNY